jgi:spermidine/putrescine transport system substrate-binding protein
MMALALVACGKSESPAQTTAESPPATAEVAKPAQACKLNLFIWSEYIDPQIIADFETQTGCKVTIDLYEDNESMVAKLQGGGDSLYDVVVPGQYIIPVMVKLNLLAPLRKENIPNMANLDDKFANPSFDPNNTYSVAYQWGTVGIYWRKQPGKAIPRSWSVIFDKSQQAGSFLLMDSIREMMGTALRYKGYSVNATDAAQLTEIRDMLRDAKGRSQGLEGGVGGKNKVLGKNVDMAIVYNGDAIRGVADDPDTEYFVPDEGGVLWVDNLAIPAKAPHRDTAEQFINFLLDPKVGAQLSNFNQYATPNKAARAFINPDDLANPAIYPPAELMAKMEFVVDVGDANRLYDEVWTQVRSE